MKRTNSNGGGGGPKLMEKSLPPYRFEQNCGGGGGPKLMEKSLPPYRFEQNCGGGGGPAEEASDSEVVKYTVNNTIDIKKKKVTIDVNIELIKYNDKIWKQITELPQKDILQPNVVDANGKTLSWHFENGDIIVNLLRGDERSTFLQVTYSAKIEKFFIDYSPNDEGFAFAFFDKYWCEYFAELFKITLDCPSRTRISKINPSPFDIVQGNKIEWERKNHPKNERFKIRMEGKFMYK